MKTNKYYVLLLLLLAVCLGTIGCSKDKDSAEPLTGKASLTMKVDEKDWGATITTFFTEEDSNSELGDFYRVLVGGQYSSLQGDNSDVSGITMYIAVPKSKFNNPKGTYAVMKESEAQVGQATALYVVSTDADEQAWYTSYNPTAPTEAVGTIEITDFEIGDQIVAGQSSGIQGYTNLSGTFKMDMYPTEGSPGSVLKITEGKFNMKSAIGFDF